MIRFSNAVSHETNIATISHYIEAFKECKLLKLIIQDPHHNQAVQCLKSFVVSRNEIPHNFVQKLLSILTARVSVMPAMFGIMNNSYTTKISLQNVLPNLALTNVTAETRQHDLREDAKNSVPISRQRQRIMPQVLRLNLKDDLLAQCVNAMADLNTTIMEGNRAAGYGQESIIKRIAGP